MLHNLRWLDVMFLHPEQTGDIGNIAYVVTTLSSYIDIDNQTKCYIKQ